MTHWFSDAAGWLHATCVIPALYALGLMAWEETALDWLLLALFGAAQVVLMLAVCVPLERWRPVERWADARVVWTDVLYTFITRAGLLPLFAFVLFRDVQAAFTGWLVDAGWTPPTLEALIPGLIGLPVVSFILYVLLLDLADYWRHRLQHAIPAWYALHAVHHAQRQMTFWTDDRNHLVDDLIALLWFGAVALMIGIPPQQFPLVLLVLKTIESLSHANVRLSYGRIGERLLVSPRFHRAHHGVLAAGQDSVNYGAIFPFWDMIFRTADFSCAYVRTGDPDAPEALATGSWLRQQLVALRGMILRRRHQPRGGAVDARTTSSG
jgi:sterol desaturase/sphingolipid hydroxylase (fatty acid hydroxylase superfamily)